MFKLFVYPNSSFFYAFNILNAPETCLGKVNSGRYRLHLLHNRAWFYHADKITLRASHFKGSAFQKRSIRFLSRCFCQACFPSPYTLISRLNSVKLQSKNAPADSFHLPPSVFRVPLETSCQPPLHRSQETISNWMMMCGWPGGPAGTLGFLWTEATVIASLYPTSCVCAGYKQAIHLQQRLGPWGNLFLLL